METTAATDVHLQGCKFLSEAFESDQMCLDYIALLDKFKMLFTKNISYAFNKSCDSHYVAM